MIRCELYSPRCEWDVTVFFAIDEYWVGEIIEKLWEIGIDSANAKKAYQNISSGEINTGLCYSNYELHKSVMVIGMASDAAELFNSLLHEFKHLSSHMAKACGLEDTGEEIAYATGELAHDMWRHIKHLLCDCCREKELNKSKYDYGYGLTDKGTVPYYE